MQKLYDAVKELLDNRPADYLHEDDRAMLMGALPLPADPALRDRAVAEYATDEIEIDDVAYISQANDGTWVSAWVWVPNEDEDDD